MFIKHVGKQGDRKVAIVFREVPGEDHMCLVVYPDILPMALHDSIMKTIESPEGQAAENLGDALFRTLGSDGRPMLQVLHMEGMIKKVQTSGVIVTPAPNQKCRLDELNDVLRQMKLGEDAVKKLADLDADAGITGKVRPKDDFGRELGAPNQNAYRNLAGSNNTALDDQALATNFRQQAEKMAAEAKGLLAESARLMKEAAQMEGIPLETVTDKPKRGRPSKKAQAVNAS